MNLCIDVSNIDLVFVSVFQFVQDMFFRQRTGDDHEATSGIKSEMMQLWDGLISDNTSITVLAATNR
jgi:hypothetical protein